MQIQKIKAAGNFIHRYVQVNGSVFTLKHALLTYPKFSDKIKKANYSLDFNNQMPVTTKFKYPSVQVMQNEIENSMGAIIKKLKLNPPKNQLEEFVCVYKLYDYFTNSLTYSMLAQEERGYQFEDNNYYMSALKQNRLKLREFNLKPAPAVNERVNYRTQKMAIYQQMEKENDFFKKNVTFSKENYIKGLYNVFIRKRGVCSEFSNAYIHILNKLDIKSYKVLVNKFVNGVELFHAYNLIEFNKGQEKSYYACDLTRSVCNKQKYDELKQKNKILGFGMGSEQLEDTDNTQILSIQRYSQDSKREFFPEIEGSILEKDLSQKLLSRLIAMSEKIDFVEEA
jgi:hypothetical protein